MDRRSNTRGVVALAAMVFLTAAWAGADRPAGSANAGDARVSPAEGSAGAVQAFPNAWRVDIASDQTGDTTGSAWSPVASAPEVLADADDGFGSSIRYMCFSGGRGGISLRLQTVSIQFDAEPRPVMTEGAQEGERGPIPLEVRTTWDREGVTLQAHVVRNAIVFDQMDAADRAAGRSSSAEFLRRLLRSGPTGAGAVEIELDWKEVGPVSYTFSLEGAADSVREAGGPCGVR